MYDVVTLGETMIRLSPPGMQRFDQATQLDFQPGGSESNVAVGLARLGLNVCWLSRLTDNPLGRLIAGTITRYGVDTSRVVWTDADRVGVYYVEHGVPPRPGRVIYDRANSAMSRMQPDDLPDDLFQPGNGRLLHVTGITPAIGAGAVVWAAVERAKAAGWRISFDVNYRGKLWTPEACREACAPFIEAADVVFIPYGDAQTVYGLTQPPEDILTTFMQAQPNTTFVMSLSAEGAAAGRGTGDVIRQSAFPAERVDRVGGGDALAVGFLYHWLLDEADLALALRWGAAVAALKYTIPGDFPLVDKSEVAALVESGGSQQTISR